MSASLLVELFTEELPPKALKALGDAFAQGIASGLAERGLLEQGHQRKAYCTPRRLAVHLTAVLAKSFDREQTKKLMPATVALDATGKPTPALLKRLQKEGHPADVDVSGSIERRSEGGMEYVFLHQIVPGVPLAAALQLVLEETIARLPIPKLMTYQLADGETTVQFVRPVHGLVALHGADLVPVSVLGLDAGRVTHGHRFQGVKDIPVDSADAYEEALAAHGRVIAAFDARRAATEKQLREQAALLGASLGPEEDIAPLLDEVSALVEFPSVYTGEFEPEFLVVPQECLVLTMRTNQKYFPLFDGLGKLSNRFLIVSNMRLAEPKNVVDGNNRVVRPRLADARFFFETDKKTRLEARVPQLGTIVYHNKLGSQLERVERVQLFAGKIARAIGADPALAERAAWLAKADLVTSMVGEFPELQGIMGRYYALSDGEPVLVAIAVEQHYRPRFAGDALPENDIALAVALADKLETLAGMFGIGQQPSGDKDPFALRRHALGVIRILIEGELKLLLPTLIGEAFALFARATVSSAHTDLETFVYERLRSHLREAGYSANEIEAVLCMRPARLDQVPRQLAAVRTFAGLPEAASLAAANKRVANILKQAEAKGESLGKAEVRAMKEPAERNLFDALEKASGKAMPLFEAGDYTGYLKAFAALKSPVDAFFDSVMVMVDDQEVRRNRLALLQDLRDAMNRVADISKLAA
ncbi:MAG TPA: glycine--tRNA ligase subunit beta [Burkholderiales bacterium]|nr:glycine--tRNA ligase subunit beta [Burkholderiales bacterium]